MIKSDEIDKLTQALSEFQSEDPDPPRNKTVKVKTKSGGTYTFSYAPLDEVWDAIREPLYENGLSVTQLIGSGTQITTILMHESGQYIGETFDPTYILSFDEKEQNTAFKDMQDVGSTLTYGKRYALEAVLGIVAQDDDDANKQSGNTIKSKKKNKKPKSKKNKKSSKSKEKSKSKDKDKDWEGGQELLDEALEEVEAEKGEKNIDGELSDEWKEKFHEIFSDTTEFSKFFQDKCKEEGFRKDYQPIAMEIMKEVG